MSVKWADRVASVVSGEPASLVSYSPTVAPSHVEGHTPWSGHSLVAWNKSQASASGLGDDYGRHEYLDIATVTPRSERDFASERAYISTVHEKEEHIPASVHNEIADRANNVYYQSDSQGSKKSSWKSWRS